MKPINIFRILIALTTSVLFASIIIMSYQISLSFMITCLFLVLINTYLVLSYYDEKHKHVRSFLHGAYDDEDYLRLNTILEFTAELEEEEPYKGNDPKEVSRELIASEYLNEIKRESKACALIVNKLVEMGEIERHYINGRYTYTVAFVCSNAHSFLK